MVVPTPPSPAPTPRTTQTWLPAAWPRSAQLATAFLLGLSTALLMVQCLGSWRWGARPTELARDANSAYRIDLNQAGRAELLQLPGVGENLAQRIVAYRQEHGAFQNVNELSGVHGVGPTTLETLRPWVRVQSASAEPDSGAKDSGKKVSAPGKQSKSRSGASKKEEHLAQPININLASAEDLQRLPGIGPKLSQRIVDERRKGPFKSPADLRRVSGIGSKTFQRLEPYITVENSQADES